MLVVPGPYEYRVPGVPLPLPISVYTIWQDGPPGRPCTPLILQGSSDCLYRRPRAAVASRGACGVRRGVVAAARRAHPGGQGGPHRQAPINPLLISTFPPREISSYFVFT
jgi:hypothetical protein